MERDEAQAREDFIKRLHPTDLVFWASTAKHDQGANGYRSTETGSSIPNGVAASRAVFSPEPNRQAKLEFIDSAIPHAVNGSTKSPSMSRRFSPDFQSHERMPFKEDGEITSSPPRRPADPPMPTFLKPPFLAPRSHTPPTQPRSFQSPNVSSSGTPARRFSNFTPNSRPLPSGPRALRNLSTGQPRQGGRSFPFNNPFPPREPSADRDPDRDRSWLLGRANNPTGWSGR